MRRERRLGIAAPDPTATPTHAAAPLLAWLPVLALAFTAACGPLPRPATYTPSCQPCDSYFQGEASACPLHVAADPGTPRFHNLVFQGGGVKGAAYAGALAVLDAKGQLAPIERVAGTSAGAIAALMVALGYTPAEFRDVVLQVDLGEFRDGSFPGDVERLVDDYGWYKGDVAQCVLECLVARKTGSKTTTFAQLHEKKEAGSARFRDLLLFATDVNTGRSVEFSHRSHPRIPLADAARISMSIPFIFAARELDDNILVDGGVLRNYPIEVFDGHAPNPATIGLHLGTSPPRERIDDLLQFTEGLVMTVLDGQVDRLCRTPHDVRRSVFIDPLGIGPLDFGLSEQQKCDLIASGARATRAFLSRETPQDTCPEWLPAPQ